MEEINEYAHAGAGYHNLESVRQEVREKLDLPWDEEVVIEDAVTVPSLRKAFMRYLQVRTSKSIISANMA